MSGRTWVLLLAIAAACGGPPARPPPALPDPVAAKAPVEPSEPAPAETAPTPAPAPAGDNRCARLCTRIAECLKGFEGDCAGECAAEMDRADLQAAHRCAAMP